MGMRCFVLRLGGHLSVATFFILFLSVGGLSLSLCDYRVPVTNILDMRLSSYYQYLDYPATPGPDQSQGRLVLGYNQLFDSPALGFTLTGSFDSTFSNLRVIGVAGEAAGTGRRYLGRMGAPLPPPYFVFGEFRSTVNTEAVQPGLELRAGLGYGRFTDVTPLSKAFLIERSLMREGEIAAPLPDHTLLFVAQEIGRRVEYEELADLVSAIAALIEEASGTTLSARAISEIARIVEEPGWGRYCGGTVQFGLGFEVLDPMGGPRDFLFTAAAAAAVAPEPGSQLLLHADFSGPYNLWEQYTFSIAPSFDYRLNDITTFTAEYSLRGTKLEGEAPAFRQSATFRLSFNLSGMGFSLHMAFSTAPGVEGWAQDIRFTAEMDLF
jgi:hypothetical protein